MIFIPFFKKIDWSNPPLVTLLLILANCLIFFVFQGDDEKLAEQAYEFYLDSDLPNIEIPLYVKYLNAQQDWEKVTHYNEYLEAHEEKQDDAANEETKYKLLMLLGPMKMDAGFYQQMKTGDLFEDKEKLQHWRTLNKEFESRLDQVTVFSHGLKPNDPTLVTLFSNMFLHGGFGHLLGNMIFLFIIGFVVEAALGRTSYTLAYILAGLCGGVLYIAFNSGSPIPTVGASGAIAGLMGMYTVLFGLRKINFFYFVFVYFDYVKAPAIVLLPIWLGHEIFQLLASSSDGVNYYAHIGGLCSGALFAFVMKRYLGRVNIDYLDQEEKDEEKKDQFETAMDYLASMQVGKALAILRPLAAEHPGNKEYLMHWYKAAKLQPAGEDYHVAARQVMLLKDKNPQTYQLIHDTYLEYMKTAQPKARMNAQLCLHLILSFALGKYFDDAEKLLAMIKNHKMKEPVAEVVLILANAFQKANDQKKCMAYLSLVAKEFESTTAAIEANKRLQSLQSAS